MGSLEASRSGDETGAHGPNFPDLLSWENSASDCCSSIKNTFPSSRVYLPLSEGTDLYFSKVLKIKVYKNNGGEL